MKKILSIFLLAFLLVSLVVPVYADSDEVNIEDMIIEVNAENIPDFAAAPLPKITEARLQTAASTLNIENTPDADVKVVRSAARVLGVATNYEELKAIVENDTLDGAYIFNNIQMEDELTIDHDFTFASLVDGIALFSAEEKIHFRLEGDGFTVNFGQVILDGGFTGNTYVPKSGGIEVTASGDGITISGGIIQNVYNRIPSGDLNPRRGGGIHGTASSTVTILNSEISENYSLAGGGIYIHHSSCNLNMKDVFFSNNTPESIYMQ